jgi:hypothetical protein
MMSVEELDRIAEGWVAEFSVDPYILKQREMHFWFVLDDLIHNQPEEALRVFERAAQKDMINWTLEGLGIGPLRSFLMIYGDRYDAALGALRKQLPQFAEMHTMAAAGL